jgi:hypothetical protein
MLRATAPLAALLATLTLAACGSSSSSSNTSSANGPAAGSTTASTAPATTESNASDVRPPPCRAADLALKILAQQGATGHGELVLALRNQSAAKCRTYGYPGVQFLDQAGNPLPTIPTHTTHDFFGTSTKQPLTVAPGSVVSFRLGVEHGAASSAGCVTAHGIQVIPPDDTASLRVTVPSGFYECGGRTTVSPLQAGEAASH